MNDTLPPSHDYPVVVLINGTAATSTLHQHNLSGIIHLHKRTGEAIVWGPAHETDFVYGTRPGNEILTQKLRIWFRQFRMVIVFRRHVSKPIDMSPFFTEKELKRLGNQETTTFVTKDLYTLTLDLYN